MSTQTAYGADSHLSVLPPIGEATYEFLNHCHRLPDTRLKPPYTRLVCHFCDKRWVLMQQESPFDPIRQVMTWVEYPNNASIQWDDPAFE